MDISALSGQNSSYQGQGYYSFVPLGKNSEDSTSETIPGKKPGTKELSEEEKQEIEELKKRDKEVRAHEQAHMAAGGGVVRGGPSYEYQKGPDGQMYAVGGEVQIDTSEAETPRATIAKMMKVRAAALAPANPSGTDRSVAAAAAAKAAEAQQEAAADSQRKGNGKSQSRSVDLFA